MNWEKIKKESNVRHIEKMEGYLVIQKQGYIRIEKEQHILFESNFENKYTEVDAIIGNVMYIGNYPLLEIYDLSTKELKRKLNIELRTGDGSYNVFKNKIILVERNPSTWISDLVCKDLESFNVVWVRNNVDIHIGYIYHINHIYLFGNDEKNLLTGINLENGELVWQFDISQYGPYKEWDFIRKIWQERRREINKVYYYRGKIIVTLSRAIIALHPDNGKLLWKIDFENYNPVDLLFDEEKAYVGRLVYYSVVDVDKGEKVFEREYDPKFRYEVEGYSLSQIVYHGLSLYKGYLWFTHEDKGRQFLLKADPATGDILEGRLLETNYSSGPPIFYGNRMYLRDQVGDLYVYEEVEEEGYKQEEEEEVYTQVLDIKGQKHILIYSESWNKELEDKLESYFIQYWIKGTLKRAEDVKFVFKRSSEINEQTLYDEMMKFFRCRRIMYVLGSLPEENVKAIAGEVVHPDYQPDFLINFFEDKENFRKIFELKE